MLLGSSPASATMLDRLCGFENMLIMALMIAIFLFATSAIVWVIVYQYRTISRLERELRDARVMIGHYTTIQQLHDKWLPKTND